MIRWLLFISLLPFFAFANDHCLPTKEYAELRNEIYTLVLKPYNECKDTTKNSSHWKAVANCLSDAKGADAFECGELVTNSEYPIEYTDLSHCKLLKPSLEFIKQTVRKSAKEKEIVQCKT